MLDRALNHLVREIVDHPDEVSVTLVDTPAVSFLKFVFTRKIWGGSSVDRGGPQKLFAPW